MNIKQLNDISDFIFEINDDEIKNNPKVDKIVQELIKDLPEELTKIEAKKLTEEKRKERNLKISKIYYEIDDKFNIDDEMDRVDYAIRKENKQIPASYEYMKEGAIRSTAWNKALAICKTRYIFSKEEIKKRKELGKKLIKAINEDGDYK